MAVKARRFRSKEWSCTRKELIIEIDRHCKESSLEIGTEKDVRSFLELKFHLLKGKTSDSHVSQVMTILGLLSFKKKETEPPIADVSKMTMDELMKAFPKYQSKKVSMISKWLIGQGRYHSSGRKSHLWRYDPNIGIWTKDGEDYIRRIVTQMTGEDYKSHICNETVNMIQNLSYDKHTDLSGVEHIIVLRDGRLDLNENKYLDGFDPDEYQISAIPIKYDKDADCPEIKKFLAEVLESEQDVIAMFELMGYTLWKGQPYHSFFIFVGVGANGKSVLLSVIESFLGADNISAMTLQQIAESNFAVARLLGKLANLAGEIPNRAIKDTSMIKDLTGGGYLDVDVKFKDRLYFKNFAKLIFSSNDPPAIYDDNLATWRRLRIFKFPKIFLKGEPGTIARDVLESRLTTDAELSGLLNEAIKGWSRLRKHGKMTGDKGWEFERLEYLKMSNPVQYFTECFITPNWHADWIPKSSIYELYLKYCVVREVKPIGIAWFHQQFKRYAPFITEGHPRSAGERRVRAYSGMDIDFDGLKEIGISLEDLQSIQFSLVDGEQTTLEGYLDKTGTGGTSGTGVGVLESRVNFTEHPSEITREKGSETPVPVVPPVPDEVGIVLDGFVEDSPPDTLKRLVNMWKRDEIEYRNGTKPDKERDLTLLLKGLDSKYVEERTGGFWWFTDLAKELIKKWDM